MDKKQGLQQLFDTVAQGYDHPSLSFFPETAKYMIQHLAPTASTPIQLLDVCTGTGVVALEVATHYEKATISAIDLSQGMLAKAQAKAQQRQLTHINFSQMDLDHLTFANQSFDYATCGFGLFFLDDMQQGLRNIAEKVKPSGKVAISTFSESAFEPLSNLFLQRYQALGYEVPNLSWKQVSTDKQLKELFSSAGMDTVNIYRQPLGFHLSSANDWWDVIWNTGYRGLLTQMSTADYDTFKMQHLQEVQQLCDAGEAWLNTGVVVTIGHV